MSRFRGPVRKKSGGFVIDLGEEESAVVRRLVGELRAMLSDPDPEDSRALLGRLFPVAYPEDADNEAEYQRLMRDELVQSKLATFDIIDAALTEPDPIDDGQMLAVMQSINSIRLVLGTMLDVSDDPDADEVTPGMEHSSEYALYGYLSWLLEHCVRALS